MYTLDFGISEFSHLNTKKFPDTEIDCRKGDGIGRTDTMLIGKFTVQQCIIEVKKQHPTANGASMNFECSTKCNCWAEFDMERWEGSDFQTCYFKNKGEY